MKKNKRWQFSIRDMLLATVALAGGIGAYSNHFIGYTSGEKEGKRRGYDDGIMDTLLYWEHHDEPSYDREFTININGEKYHNAASVDVIRDYNFRVKKREDF